MMVWFGTAGEGLCEGFRHPPAHLWTLPNIEMWPQTFLPASKYGRAKPLYNSDKKEIMFSCTENGAELALEDQLERAAAMKFVVVVRTACWRQS